MDTENLNNTIDQILGFITNQVSYVIDTTSGGLKNISQGAAAGKEPADVAGERTDHPV